MGTNKPGEFLFQYPILLPFHTVYGVLKARILKWFAIPFSSRSHSVLLELTPPKDVLFIIGDWNAKVGTQEIPGVTGKFGLGVQNESKAKANRVLPRECTGHSKHPLPVLEWIAISFSRGSS